VRQVFGLMVQKLFDINFIIENLMKSKQFFLVQLGHDLDIVGKTSIINRRY
jgi:hypothetical protein